MAHGCAASWALRYRALMERYQHIVRFSMFGYTHRSEFSVTKPYYNETANIGITFIPGSLTTFKNVNPQFAVMDLDAEFLVPLSMSIYSLNVTNANENNTPTWKLLFNYTKDYQMTDLSPDSLYNIAKKVRTDKTFANQVLWNQAGKAGSNVTCNASCQEELFCDMTNTDYFNAQTCKGMQQYDFLHDPFPAVINTLTANWVK